MFGSEGGAGPKCGLRRNRIEIEEGIEAAAGAIVIPAHTNLSQRPYPLYDFVWVGAVAYRVAEVPHRIMLRSRRQNCVQGIEVGVNIGENEGAHT